MKVILFIHILCGSLAILGAYATLFAPKGQRLHGRAGMLFVYAMLAMGFGATIVGLAREQITWLGGLLVVYLVATATRTVRQREKTSPILDIGLTSLATGLGITFIGLGVKAASSPGGQLQDVPAPVLFMDAAVALLAVTPLLVILAVLPLVLMVYWLWRVRGRREDVTRHAPSIAYATVTPRNSR